MTLEKTPSGVRIVDKRQLRGGDSQTVSVAEEEILAGTEKFCSSSELLSPK